MSRARSVSQLVGANTALGNTTISGALATGNTVITGTANVSSTLAAGNTTITGNMSLTSSTTPNFYIETSNTSVNQNLWLRSNGVDTFGIEAQSNTGGAGAFLSNRNPGGAINFRTTTSGASLQTAMTLDGLGRVTMPYQPCFFAFKTDETSLSQGNKIPFQSAPVNIGSHYNTSTSRFTAPIAGRYLIQAKVQFASGSSSVYAGINLTLNGAIYSESYSSQYTNNAHIVPVVCVILQLNAGDYVEIIVGAIAAGAPMIQGSNDKRSVFMGYLLG